MRNRSIFSELGVLLLLASAACGGGGRYANTVASEPHPEVTAYVPIQRTR